MKKLIYSTFLVIAIGCLLSGCQLKTKNTSQEAHKIMKKGSYGFDKDFLNEYTDVVELKNGSAALLLVPAWQGRVMTSTCNGDEGFSFGWMNYDLIQQKKFVKQFNPFGGEERFWIGPEGGQFSIYFKKGSDFDIKDWQVPPAIDTETFDLVSKTETTAEFRKEMHLVNYSGNEFHLEVNREITLLKEDEVEKSLQISTDNVSMVSYQSDNSIKNTGENSWEKDSGLLSIWMLGMLIPSPEVTVVVPVKEGDIDTAGEKVNDNYFGKISNDRLKVVGNTVFFKADGKSRGKIGISPMRSKGIMGSYDAQNNALTILACEIPEDARDFVNSAWELQDNPYSGDALNSYNDGPLEDGSQMGPFYELESSSPALALKANESYVHTQRTYHFKGDKSALDKIAVKLLGVSLSEIEKAF